MSRGLPIGVSALIIVNDNGVKKIALTLRNKNCRSMHGLWALPGGAAEDGEFPSQTAIREVKEEIGLIIHDPFLRMDTILDADDGWWYNICYECSLNQDENNMGDLINLEPDKFDDVNWFDINNLPENTAEFVKQIVEYYKTGNFNMIPLNYVQERSII